MMPVLLIFAIFFQIQAIMGGTNVQTIQPIQKQFCDYDAFISSKQFNDKVYLYPYRTDDRRGDWYQARGYCAEHCAELVTIQSAEENVFFLDFVRSVGITEAVWIGAQTEAQKDFTQWSNGEPVKYTNKAAGEYNEGFAYGPTCINAAANVGLNLWYNYVCSYTNYFVACQRPASWVVCE